MTARNQDNKGPLEVSEEVNLDADQRTGESQPPLELNDADQENNKSAKDEDGIPYCRRHHCRMKQASGGSKGNPKSYYACPIRKCEEKAQKIKSGPAGIVPPKPQACPRCSKPKKPVYCEKDDDRSTSASVILRCPDCGWKSNTLAVPQLAAAHFARRQSEPVEEIGRR